jgi:hypothetical protein
MVSCGAAWLAAALLSCPVPALAADAYTIEEPPTDTRVRHVFADIKTTGKVFTNVGGGKTAPHDLNAAAVFRFRERRLPPGGRDAEALRAVREFELATMQTRVGELDSGSELPANLRLIVASGRREGVRSYCPDALLTRDAVDLLELPGDPLGLTALLPRTAVEVGAEWKPADWATQMLATIEAIDKQDLTCRLASVNAGTARIDYAGKTSGQRFGANTEVEIKGHLLYDVTQKFVRAASAKYVVKSSIGTVSPGVDATVDVTVERSLSRSPGRLTDKVAEALALTPPPESLQLEFDAAPWGVRLKHDRNWYVFQALLEGTPRVVILRLMEQGSLICQCNVSPIPSAPAGQHTPAERFEADIQQALGDRFQGIVSREKVPTADGRTILRIVTQGEFEVAGDKAAVRIPMNWLYYLVAAPDGRQTSFVFAVEPAYLPTLADRDLQMVKSLEFTRK